MAFEFQPPPPPSTVQFDTPTVGRGRRRGWIIVGAVLLALGVAVGTLLMVRASTAVDDTVQSFARAPIGCTTTLQFDHSGLFTFYVETKGTIGTLGGDCSHDGGTFHHAGSVPTVNLDLTDAAGAPVALTNFRGVSYSTGRYSGTSVAQVLVGAAGTYRLQATADVTDIGVSIGGNPAAYRNELITWSVISGAVGVLIGGALIVFGARRRDDDLPPLLPPAGVPGPWAPPSW